MSYITQEHKRIRPVVVVSQPMYFPWVGLLEQVSLANIFVHYEDVQFTRGFFNRVQIKAPEGIKWITIPLKKHHRDQKICEVYIDYHQDWRTKHRNDLCHAYHKAPFLADMLMLVDRVFSREHSVLADLAIASLMTLVDYFDLSTGRQFFSSKTLGIAGESSQRLLNLCSSFGARKYITGHGARNYLQHELFDNADIAVEYMDYQCVPYPQLHGSFTPYVSALDLIANCGTSGIQYILSNAIPYKEFIREH